MRNVVDEHRVAEIAHYEVLVRPPRQDLVALVEVAAQVAQVPMATINLITATEQHQIATTGFDASVCRREDSMCAAVLHVGHPVIVSDASRDERFRDNPFVTGEIGHVRFYATHQLVTPQGVVIGTLCVFDERPRTLTPDQEHALASLADRVVDLLELDLRTRELEDLHDELERSNEQLAAFAGQVSHDLRNPLAALSISLRLLDEKARHLEPGPDTEMIARLAGRAIAGADRMQALIDDLLAYARLGGELSRVEVDLARTMAEVREDLGPALEGATLEVGDLPTVEGDAVQLRAVLQNLVANAAKFTCPGEPAHVAVDSVRTADGWRVRVVDHGLGVPEGDRERVFEPFTRVHPRVPGSGIGLATVRRVVEAHGGRIGLEGTPGGGTTAWFELPA
ncbi:sensor histidine kinase [Nocardioides sp. MAHUQ-72]|uniref:sensor histidine kinase n=1 Tax=unclassified Nocardioides TaxID=2615069 RepID=UPI003616BEF4